MTTFHFPDAFRALTGTDPFPWQSGLFQRFIHGRIPASCNLPTGLGKTSVILGATNEN
jgi:CRISPR-associated endonuclease/helicase Cas3